jgi:hypothetical protein
MTNGRRVAAERLQVMRLPDGTTAELVELDRLGSVFTALNLSELEAMLQELPALPTLRDLERVLLPVASPLVVMWADRLTVQQLEESGEEAIRQVEDGQPTEWNSLASLPLFPETSL